jgi:hypothetical protein
MLSLAGMKRGEGWVWSPEINFGPKRITFPMFRTYDSFKGANISTDKLKGWAEVNLDEIKEKLSVLITEAKNSDPKELRARIAQLERELKHANARIADVSGKLESVKIKQPVTIPCKNTKAEEAFRKRVSELINAGHNLIAEMSEPKLVNSQYRQVESKRNPVLQDPVLAVDGIGKGEATILAAAIQFKDTGVSKQQLGVLTSYKRSSRDAYIARLLQKGYVVVNNGMVFPSPDGMCAMPDAKPLPTGKDLQDYWISKLPAGEKAVLQILIDKYPSAVDRNDIDSLTGYKRSSRDAYLARLSAKNLVVEVSRGNVAASENLF